jgi:hypothetical protein
MRRGFADGAATARRWVDVRPRTSRRQDRGGRAGTRARAIACERHGALREAFADLPPDCRRLLALLIEVPRWLERRTAFGRRIVLEGGGCRLWGVAGSPVDALLGEPDAVPWPDAAGLGVSHHPNLVDLALLFATLYPAPLDPKFAGSGLDPGYLTTEPGTREQDFDAPDHPDPGVVSTDEATKDVISATEAPDAVAAVLLPLSISINVPVLLADGQHDPPATSDPANALAGFRHSALACRLPGGLTGSRSRPATQREGSYHVLDGLGQQQVPGR